MTWNWGNVCFFISTTSIVYRIQFPSERSPQLIVKIEHPVTHTQDHLHIQRDDDPNRINFPSDADTKTLLLAPNLMTLHQRLKLFRAAMNNYEGTLFHL